MLSDALLNNLVYDANGLVSWDSGTSYVYDPMDQRVGKAASWPPTPSTSAAGPSRG